MDRFKFRVWDNKDYMSLPFNLSDIQSNNIQFTSDCIVMQYTGLCDLNGVEIYEGDILNIYYTTDNTHNHDGIYTAHTGALGDVVFKFKKLLWSNYGYNQYPFNTTLCQEYRSLDYRYNEALCKNELRAMDGSTYFEVIGNIYTTPELLKP